jgi:hypothetical protein
MSAISSGETPSAPSVSAQAGTRWLVTPSRCAMATTFFTPTFAISWAKIVFTEFAVALRRFIVPACSSP